MAIAKGSNKQLRAKRQTAKGTPAVAGTGGQIIRRETATFDLAKEAYTTETEQTSRKQLTSSRHGPRLVNGSLTGLFSPGTYADFLAAILMRDWTAVADITGLSITVAGTGPTYTLTRASGSWLTDGVKIGRVVRPTAGSFAAGNLNKNMLVVGATATVLTVMPLNKKALVAEGPIAAATVEVPGAVTWVPESGHTDVYYTVEEWFPDVPRSQVSHDVKFTAATMRLPGSGNAGIDFTALGLDQTKDAAVYYTAPTPETTTDVMVAASGALLVNGVKQAVVTDLSFNIDTRAAAADPVVGENIRPDVFTGKVMVSGSLTAYYESADVPDLYDDEVATSIVSALAAGNADNADFHTIVLHNVKLNSSTPDDVETGLKRTYNFIGVYNAAGGAALATSATTIELQDSTVVPA